MDTESMTGIDVKALMRFPDFAQAAGSLRQNTIAYLDGELNVRLKPFKDTKPIFNGNIAGWDTFCQSLLGARNKVAPVKNPFQLHRWNTDFHWRNTRLNRQFLTAEQAAQFDEHGWVVLRSALHSALVRSLEEEADRFESMSERKLRDMREGQSFIARPDEITFTTHLVRRSKLYAGFYKTQFFRSVCKDLIGDDVRLYWDQAVYKKPGVSKPFPWHQDNGYTFVDPQQYLTFWIALTEATLDNGCMWLVRGVHRAGTIQHDLTDIGYDCFPNGAENAVPIPAAPGDVIVLSSLTPHQTGSNTTLVPRKALVAQFVPSGAVARTEDSWGRTVNTPATDPVRQFEILRGGEPVV